MAFLNPRSVPEPPLLRIEPFRGLNLSLTPTQINNSQAAEMLNMRIGRDGSLEKRTGFEKVFQTSLGTGQINGLYQFRKIDGSVYFLIAHGGKLYKQEGNNQPIEIYDDLEDQQTNFFTMNNKCYLMDGANYLVFDGEMIKEVEPYIPTISISKEPAGGGSGYEDFNLLGSGFKDSFSGDGTAKEYFLSLKGLDDTPIKAKVDGIDKEETIDFTVDRITGKITFNVVPPKGTNNVVITAYKSFVEEMRDYFNGDGKKKVFQLSRAELDENIVTASFNTGKDFDKVEGTDFTIDREKGNIIFFNTPPTGTNNIVVKTYKKTGNLKKRVLQCRFHTFYGGSNDTRIFISGNKDMPEYVFASGLYDPTYFEENRFYKFPDTVMGFAKQYDYLVIERESGKHQITFELLNGSSSFPSKPINDQVGTLAPNSIQIIENTPVSLSKNGVYRLVSSNIRDERNVQSISDNINQKLLKEPNLEKAISIEHDKKYWLALNGNVYIFDYQVGEWYVYDNIHASSFIEIDRELYFGSSMEGLLYRFKKETEVFPYNDDGVFINAYWKSAKLNFDTAERNKLVQKLFATMNPMRHTSCNFYYVSDMVTFPQNKENLPDYSKLNYAKSFYNDKIFDAKTEFIDSSRNEWFDYEIINYSKFTYNTSEESDVVAMKVKAKKVAYFQLVIQNTRLNEGLKIDNLALKFVYQNYRK